jgi:succinate dehydrogenase flavin-adding protein (antitoxin of CptAB toxin-antitoxin module)
LKVPIKRGVSEKLVLVAKYLEEDEERFGSITIMLDTYFGE